MRNRLGFGHVALYALFAFVEADAVARCTHIAVVGICHFTRSVHHTAHHTNFQVCEVACGCLHLLHGGLQVEHGATATWARDELGFRHTQTRGLQYGKRIFHHFLLTFIVGGFEPYAIGKSVEQDCAQVGTSLHLQPFGVGVGIVHTHHHWAIHAHVHHGVEQRLQTASHVLIGSSGHYHHVSQSFQRQQLLFRYISLHLHPLRSGGGIGGEIGESNERIGVRAVGDCAVGEIIVRLQFACYVAEAARCHQCGHLLATNLIKHGERLAAHRQQRIVALVRHSLDGGMAGTAGDVLHQLLSHRHLHFGVFAKRYTNGVAQAFRHQATNAHGALDTTVFAKTSLSNAQMQRKVHIFGIHGRHHAAHSLHHHHHI